MKKIIGITVLPLLAVLMFVPSASGHATVSVFPGGTALAGARTTYVLRVPNERPNRATIQITMSVPEPMQRVITVLHMPTWHVTLRKQDTGQVDGEGNKIFAVTEVVWTALKGHQIMPGFYTEVFFRFQNPATAQQLCFPTKQQYGRILDSKGKPTKGTKAELVNWNGPAGSATPASCVNVVK